LAHDQDLEGQHPPDFTTKSLVILVLGAELTAFTDLLGIAQRDRVLIR
jgi:hypothetical protein